MGSEMCIRDRFRRYGRFSIFQDGCRPPSWIGFTRVGTTHEEYLILCDCAKFGCSRCRNFDSMQILIFCTLSLKMLIHAPKIGFFGGDFTPKMRSSTNEIPKRHILGRKHVVCRIVRQNRSTCAGSARSFPASFKFIRLSIAELQRCWCGYVA